jgi:hypothetical protein
VAQLVGKEVRLIDFVENHGVGLDWYVNWLKENRYERFDQYLPHDVAVRELGTGRSRQEVLQEAGLEITVAPRLSVADGIQAVRRLLPRCWFDKDKTKQGVNALRNYRREYNEKQNVYYEKPLHDWCFTEDTNVLTRNGTYQIMNLPKSGEVLTSCGWKQYTNPRITRKNASLVEVQFKNGYTVRCTPDHLFKTESGWKSAESLTKGLRIQSTLTRLHNTLTVAYTGSGLAIHTCLGVVKNFIEMCGVAHLVRFLRNVTSIIKTITHSITQLRIWNVCQPKSIFKKQCKNELQEVISKDLLTQQEKKRQNGISQTKEGFGIKETQKEQKIGLNGSVLKKLVQFVISNLKGLSAKAATHKSIARLIAKPLFIEGVKRLDYLEDVWCITVQDVEEFSLSNGAVVHNCSHASDAMRYLAITLDESDDSWSSNIPINTKWVV